MDQSLQKLFQRGVGFQLPGEMLLTLVFCVLDLSVNVSTFFLNWDSLHARLNSHCEAWSYKKRSTKKITGYRKSV